MKSVRVSRNLVSHDKRSSSPAKCTSLPIRPLPVTDRSPAHSWNTYHDRVEECLDKTLASLGTDYLDLYLVHWPVRLVANETSELFPLNPDGSRATDRSWNQQETWRQMEEVLAKGKCVA